jgi:hypothetical protein
MAKFIKLYNNFNIIKRYNIFKAYLGLEILHTLNSNK